MSSIQDCVFCVRGGAADDGSVFEGETTDFDRLCERSGEDRGEDECGG